MKTFPFLEDLLFVSEILFCPRGIINKPTVNCWNMFFSPFLMFRRFYSVEFSKIEVF
jgi:hypothetical protein